MLVAALQDYGHGTTALDLYEFLWYATGHGPLPINKHSSRAVILFFSLTIGMDSHLPNSALLLPHAHPHPKTPSLNWSLSILQCHTHHRDRGIAGSTGSRDIGISVRGTVRPASDRIGCIGTMVHIRYRNLAQRPSDHRQDHSEPILQNACIRSWLGKLVHGLTAWSLEHHCELRPLQGLHTACTLPTIADWPLPSKQFAEES